MLKKVTGVLAGGRDDASAAQDGPAEPVADLTTTAETAAAADADATDAPATAASTAAHDDAGPVIAGPVAEPQEDLSMIALEPAAPDTTGRPSPDERCAAAVDLARAAAEQVSGGPVGEHLGVEADPAAGDGHLADHSFASTDPAYVGWRWVVSVARAESSDVVTVDEVVLLPGEAALLAPAWVPWAERVEPGDLGAGDLLPPPPDDPRLVPAYAEVDAEPLPFDLHRELGLGRPRVLSLDGRADAAERWYEGEAGPNTPLAKAAPGRCAGCGFLVPVAGALGRVFGVCANAQAPDDGRVVALTHGCGAHSETVVEQPESTYSGMAVEHEELEMLDTVISDDDVMPDDVRAGDGLSSDDVQPRSPGSEGSTDDDPADDLDDIGGVEPVDGIVVDSPVPPAQDSDGPV